MITKKMYLFVIIFLLSMNTCVWAQVGFKQQNMLHKNEPIEIVSDKMTAFQEKNVVIFSGNAVATQGDVKLKTDRLSIYYKKSQNKNEKPVKQAVEAAGDLEKIEAKGNVVVTQKDMSAVGSEAVYYQDTARVIMTGNPVLRQGKNVIKGCKVTVYIDQNRGEVEKCDSEKSGRVTAIIHPEEKKIKDERTGLKPANGK